MEILSLRALFITPYMLVIVSVVHMGTVKVSLIVSNPQQVYY